MLFHYDDKTYLFVNPSKATKSYKTLIYVLGRRANTFVKRIKMTTSCSSKTHGKPSRSAKKGRYESDKVKANVNG